MSRDQCRRLLIVFVALTLTLVVVFALGLNDVARWSALETRGVQADAAITGFEPQSKHPGYIVDYVLSTKAGASVAGGSYLPLRLCRKLSVGDRIAAVYDPLRPSRSALLASFPNDGGHPFRTWFRKFGAMMCLLVPVAFVSSVITTWNRGASARRGRPWSPDPR